MSNKARINSTTKVKAVMQTQISRVLGVLLFLFLCACFFAQQQPVVSSQKTISQAQLPVPVVTYTTFFYKSGNLNIEAYLYKPEGNGPFPLIVYNHGSRAGQERVEKPMKFIADILVPHGYAVLVPERRGYGKSDGQTFGEEVGSDISSVMMKRFREEASDVIAALDYLEHEYTNSDSRFNRNVRVLPIDFHRIGIIGWSHGGVVSLITASERHVFVGLVNQAGGALTWNRSSTLQTELPKLGGEIKIPGLCLDAENDATTNAVKRVGEAIKSSGEWEKTIIYPAFTPTSNPSHIAPGHLIFAQGVSIWQNDVLDFLAQRFAATRVPRQP